MAHFIEEKMGEFFRKLSDDTIARVVGYAKLILSKEYGSPPDTITNWVKAYRKHITRDRHREQFHQRWAVM